MHIPDGFLDARTALTAGVLATAGLGLALRNVRRTFPPHRVPLIGLTAAFVFAAQMVNFPVAGGTSGHLTGAVLAAVLLGPSAAALVLSSVLFLQCFLFADGGVTALGANVFNMAIVAPGAGYAVYATVRRFGGDGLRARLLATGFASWCATVIASIGCAGQLALSGTVDWRLAFPAMAGIHMLVGLGEALITTLAIAAVARTRPELLPDAPEHAGSPRALVVAAQGFLVAVGLVIFVVPFASGWPDGLESVARAMGFESHAAATPAVTSPMTGYAVHGLGLSTTSTVVAGCIGTAVSFALAYLLARSLTPAPGPNGRTNRKTNGQGGGDTSRASAPA